MFAAGFFQISPHDEHPVSYTHLELLAKARDDREVIMDHAMEDLAKAINMIPSTKRVYYVKKWTALALKTRAALYEGTYRKYRNMPNAEKYLNQVVDAGENFIRCV